MISVLQTTKDAWMSDREVNHIVVTFPNLNLTYTDDKIAPASLVLKESISNSDSMEFIGCIASSLKMSIFDVPDEIKGELIQVTVQAGSTEVIPLFIGYVDSVEIDANSLFKNITAYDALYEVGQVDVANWYNGLVFPMTLKQFRDSLFSYVGITQEVVTLPNDDISISRQLDYQQEIAASTIMKSICQFNGCCGIINRTGEFEYRYVVSKTISTVEFAFDFYESLKHEEFHCNPIQKVQIRDSEDDAGVIAGSGRNKYIIQNNILAYGLAKDTLKTAATNILLELNNLTYYPMRSVQNGLPFLEVGDSVSYNVPSVGYGVDVFLILSRTLSGVQFCRDTYESRGVQNQSEYLTDIEAQLSALQRTTNELKSLNDKTIDYLLPTTIDASAIAAGGNNNVLEFDFYSNKEDEKTSFYSCVTFEAETTDDAQTETYGDYTLTAVMRLDGVAMETAIESGGDGNKILFLNYLMQSLTKGNHTFTVNFALSGGSISNMNFVSAYLLAASSVQDNSGSEYDEYDIFDDDGNWGSDVLVDGLTPEMMTEEAYESGVEESMIKYALSSTPIATDYDVQTLSEYFRTKYLLCAGNYYAEPFYMTNGCYRKDGEKGYRKSNTGESCGYTATWFYIPIKRITGYHFLKYKGITIQNNGNDPFAGDQNFVRCGVAYVDENGELQTIVNLYDFKSVEEWTEYSVGISTCPYVDYIVLYGGDGSPAYKDIYFAR